MKKRTNNLIIISLSALCLMTLWAFKGKTEHGEGKLIMIRSFEPFNKLVSADIVVTDGEKILKTIELEPSRLKSHESNPMKITSVLNEFVTQGYRVIGMTGSIDDAGATTYLLEKK